MFSNIISENDGIYMSIKYAKAIKELQPKTSVRRKAKLFDVSVSTVMWVKALL